MSSTLNLRRCYLAFTWKRCFRRLGKLFCGLALLGIICAAAIYGLSFVNQKNDTSAASHFNVVFVMSPLIVAASLFAFLVGSFLIAFVMSRMKIASRGRNFSARAIWSTVVGETADSLIFFPIAFGGVIAWRELAVMMGLQILLKSAYEVVILPVTIRVVKAVKRIDGSDVYDEGISYKVWKVKDI